MIEEHLVNYGVLGLWTIWLIYEKQKLLAGLQKALTKNSEVLNKVCKLIQVKGGR